MASTHPFLGDARFCTALHIVKTRWWRSSVWTSSFRKPNTVICQINIRIDGFFWGGALHKVKKTSCHWQEQPMEVVPPFTADGFLTYHRHCSSHMLQNTPVAGFVSSFANKKVRIWGSGAQLFNRYWYYPWQDITGCSAHTSIPPTSSR